MPNTTQRLAILDADLAALRRAAPSIGPALVAARQDGAGIRARSFDGVGGRSGISDPTASRALHRDPVDEAATDLRRLLDRIHDSAVTLTEALDGLAPVATVSTALRAAEAPIPGVRAVA